MATVYSFNHLWDLKWFGDERINEFLKTWEKIWNALDGRDQLTADCKRDMFAKEVAKSHVLKVEYAHYEREVDHKRVDGTFEFLWKACESLINRREEKKRVEEQRTAFQQMAKGGGKQQRKWNDKNNGWSGPALPAAGADAKGKGGGKGKGGKGKKGDVKRSASAPANVRPTGKSGKLGKGKGGGTQHKEKCWYHSAATHIAGHKGCKNSAKECSRSHDLIPKKEFEEMAPPGASGSASRSGTPAGKGKGKKKGKDGKGKGKGGKNRASSPANGKVKYCMDFLNNGTCKFKDQYGHCNYPHMNQAQLDAAQKKAGAAAPAPGAANQNGGGDG
jgi:hypothetical protein